MDLQNRRMSDSKGRTLFSFAQHPITQNLQFLYWLVKPTLFNGAALAMEQKFSLGLHINPKNEIEYIKEKVPGAPIRLVKSVVKAVTFIKNMENIKIIDGDTIIKIIHKLNENNKEYLDRDTFIEIIPSLLRDKEKINYVISHADKILSTGGYYKFKDNFGFLKNHLNAVEVFSSEGWTSPEKGSFPWGKLIRRSRIVDEAYNAPSFIETYVQLVNWILSSKPYTAVLRGCKTLQNEKGMFSAKEVRELIGHRSLFHISWIIEQCLMPEPPDKLLKLGIINYVPGAIKGGERSRKGPFVLHPRYEQVRRFGCFLALYKHLLKTVRKREGVDIRSYKGQPLPVYIEIPKLRVLVESLYPHIAPDTDNYIETFLDSYVDHSWSEMDQFHTTTIGLGLHGDRNKLIFNISGKIKKPKILDGINPWSEKDLEI